MPNIDGGHYFLSLLAPVKLGETAMASGELTTYSQLLRTELANMPTAQQSQVSVRTGLNSPFARCRRTHFLRLFIIEQPMFNGRDPINPLWNIIKKRDPLVHQPYDVLSRPWLMLSADFDLRPAEPDQGLQSWAEGLWVHSQDEMRAIFSNCYGFDGIETAPQFATYLKRCQLDTTMSFNDYWPGRPPLKGIGLGRLVLAALAIGAALFALLWLISGTASLWFTLPALALAVGIALWRLWAVGKAPFPPAPNSDLKSVLKALHVQQRFAFLAESTQGQSDEGVYRSFGAFLDIVRPSDLEAPTQPPGVIRSDGVQLADRELIDDKDRQAMR